MLASIVEREAQLDEERPLIAGVYQNRLDPKKFPLGKLQSDPTIFYVHDTIKLRAMPFADWTQYVFWDALPAGYQLPGRPAGRPRAVQHLHQQGPAARPDLLAGRSRPSTPRSTRPPRRATSTSSPRATGPSPAPSPRRPPSTRRTSRSTRSRVDVTLPVPGDFAPPPDATVRARVARGRACPATRPPRRAALAHGVEGVDAYFGVRPEHMRWLTGLHPRRRGGQGGRPLRPAPRRRRGRRASSPTPATRSRRVARRPTPWWTRSATTCPAPGRGSLARAGARRVAVEVGRRLARALGAARGGGPGRRAGPRRRLGRGPARAEEPRRGRADRGRLRRGGPGAGGAPAGDPARRDRARPGAPARVADADGRRGGPRLRRRLPRAARRRRCRTGARATARSSPARSSCSTSAPRWRATGAT